VMTPAESVHQAKMDYLFLTYTSKLLNAFNCYSITAVGRSWDESHAITSGTHVSKDCDVRIAVHRNRESPIVFSI
jgi:hypothetical protein